ncbi:MAG: hypothetical protein KDC98_20615 [Planctomycetes bacterium]|nr:hypothetical protein [Planctomycetota bacterium]
MKKTICLALTLAALCGDVLIAQSNSRGSGYDGALYTIGSATYYGRRGGAYPNGEIGMAFMNGLCNPGTINLQWRAPMNEDHPKFGFMVARLQNDRIVQISDWSFCKHAFLSLNDPGSYPAICGTSPCANTSSGSQMYTNCYDVYAAGNNASRNYLGPPSEINPWLGTWNHVGSYFDQGYPNVGSPGNNDGARSPINPTDNVMNRVTIREQDLLGAQSGDLVFQIQVLHEGEPAANRDNNIMSRPFHVSWSGSSWAPQTLGSASHGSIVTRWPGVTTTMGGNGNDDGRFLIGVKVTGPTDGMWHYEYVVHNIDNDRGGASFSIPVCAGGTVQNIGFRDIDQDPLDDWAGSFSGSAVTWTAPANNPHNWNTLYNYWFDSDIAPSSGLATIAQARVGPGALVFTIPTTVPGLQPTVNLGAGCGSSVMELRGNGVPTAGNNAFAITIDGDPTTGFFLLYSFAPAATTIAPGCVQYLNGSLMQTHSFMVTNGSGRASAALGIPAWFTLPMDIYWQAAPLVPGGPVYGGLGLSNGLQVRVNGTGCN